MKPYNKSNIPLAKKLRKDMTPWERHLWYDYLRFHPIRFQRQKAIGAYIVDFYCAKAGLVVELDGGGHYEELQKQADLVRTQVLESMGLTVVRICNLDVDKNFAGVCEYIDMAVQERLPLMREVARRSRDGGREESGLSPRLFEPPPSSEGGLDAAEERLPLMREVARRSRDGGRERVSPPVSKADSPLVRGGLEEDALKSTNPDKVVLALGFFDGVHVGHRALLRECRQLAGRMGCLTGAVTFDRHPGALMGGAPKLLNTVEDRVGLLERAGVERVHVLPFDAQLMATPWQSFFDRLVTEFGACGLVCGDDYRFGSRGEGNAALLKAACESRGIPCVVVPEKTLEGVRVSSTHIRALIENGEMEKAVRFLGHPHVLTGTVVQGKQLGRTLGIPTANLWLPDGVVCPRFGVYACKALVDGGEFLAVTNVGVRPTVSGEGVTVEPWLLDFEGDLYGKNLTLEFCAFLRPEKKFDSLEELAEQIRKNGEQTRQLLG